MAYELWKSCETCGGDGIAPLGVGGPGGGDVTCWHCAGVGSVKIYEVPDLQDHITDLKDGLDKLTDDCAANFADVLEKLAEIKALVEA